MSTTVVAPHKSSLGMNANLAVLVIYIVMGVVSWIPYLGWVAWAVPIVFYVLEKYSGFVKFHAVQALAIGIIRAAFSILLTIFVWILTPKTYSDLLNYATGGWGAWTVLGGISIVLGLAITALMIFMVITAWNYKQVELPIIGPIAAKIAAKMGSFATNTLGFGNNQPGQPQPPYGQQPPQPGQYQQPPQQYQQPPQPQQYQQQPPQQYQQPPQQYQQQPQPQQPPQHFQQSPAVQQPPMPPAPPVEPQQPPVPPVPPAQS